MRPYLGVLHPLEQTTLACICLVTLTQNVCLPMRGKFSVFLGSIIAKGKKEEALFFGISR